MRKRKTVLHDRLSGRFQFYCLMVALFIGLVGSLAAVETDQVFKAGLALKNAGKYQEAITEYRKIVDNKKADIKDLKKLCNRSTQSVSNAVRILANSIPHGSESEPLIYYDRIKSERNNTHRPYRIFLRKA